MDIVKFTLSQENHIIYLNMDNVAQSTWLPPTICVDMYTFILLIYLKVQLKYALKGAFINV